MPATASPNRFIRPEGDNQWTVHLVDPEGVKVIGRIIRAVEPGLNDRGPRMVIRGYDVDGNATIPANDIRHAARMLANRATR